jgi:hypothetical protein
VTAVGTFHRDHHPLHGITCVVDTAGPRLYVGRVGTIDEGGVLLMGADLFEETPGGTTKADFLTRAVRVGVWERHAQVHVPATEVRSVQPLSEVAGPG